MSITPFLPGLPVPATPDGGTTPDASAGDQGSAFGDALAAALAGTLGVAPAVTTTVAVTAVTTGPTPPPPPSPQPSVDLPVRPVDLPVPSVDLPVPSVDLPVPPVDLAVPPVDLAVPAVELAVPDLALRRTTEGALVPVLAPTEIAAAPVAGVPGSTREGHSSTERTANSIDETAKSTDQTANSTVTTGNSTVGSGNSAVAKAVVQQVFPEVTRVVSTVGTPGGPGNGTHRITLTLQPEQLGEVRVTLVVRDGTVHVRLAGAEGVEGAAVQRVLAGEAPELQRILERTGAEARVTVRDPFAPLLPPAPANSASVSTGTQTGPDAHARSDTQARQERQEGQGTREQPHDQPRRQEPQRTSYPIEPSPVTGRLDRTV